MFERNGSLATYLECNGLGLRNETGSLEFAASDHLRLHYAFLLSDLRLGHVLFLQH